MDDKTLETLGAISAATVTMQLLKRGIRNISMAGVRPLNDTPNPWSAPPTRCVTCPCARTCLSRKF